MSASNLSPVNVSEATAQFADAKSAITLSGASDDSGMLHIGILGCGRIGQLHAENIALKINNAKLVCVSDVFESAAIKCANTYNVPMACTDPQDLIANPAVQAVIVCTPTDTHAEIIRSAAAAGKHIFCEKPVDKSLEVIDELDRVVRDAGVKFFLGFQRRFDTHFKRARDAMESGAIGTPFKLSLISRDPAPPPVAYLKQSGGIFLDQASHDFDMARFLTGSDITEITAVGVATDPEIAAIGDLDHTLCTVKFANGCIGTIDNSRSCPVGYDQRAEFFGSKGSISINNVVPNTCASTDKDGYHSDAPLNFFMERYTDAYFEEMTSFVDVVLNDKPIPCGIPDGRLTIIYAAAADLSIKEKRTVLVSEFDKPASTDAKARY